MVSQRFYAGQPQSDPRLCRSLRNDRFSLRPIGLPYRPSLSAFSVSTLIIHGTKDQTVPIDAARRAAAMGIAQSKLIEYEGAPHGLFATRKAQFAKDLLDFLKS